MPDVSVVALVPDPWDVHWQVRHHVLGRLPRYFHTIWCDPPLEWRSRLKAGALKTRSRVLENGVRVVSPGLFAARVFRPPWAARVTRRRLMRGLSRQARRTGARKIILYMWRPEFQDALDLMPHDVSFYHVDDEYSFAKTYSGLTSTEQRVLARVDQVIVHSPALMERKGGINPHTSQVPNGVDFADFSELRTEPDDLRDIPHPRIGYVGWVKWQIDFGLLLELALRHADKSFVIVGPEGTLADQKEAFERFRVLPNVYWLGGKPTADLPGYVQHLDVATMPYVISDYTNFIYPVKLHEYFATGVPVVATPIRSLQDFAGTLELASTVEDWSAAIERAVLEDSDKPPLPKERRALAKSHDWDAITQRIAGLMCERLGPNFVSRFRELTR